jgi:prepilin-type N-terminal cleavage/methylation domain-containing protein
MRTAFSLIELLVAVTILAILIAFLLPLFGSVREQARRTVCASNLRQWHLGIQGYAQDNQGKFLRCTRNVYGGATPHLMWTDDRQTLHTGSAPTMAGEWNLATMMGYLEDGSRQTDPDRVSTGGVLNCPSARWNKDTATLIWPAMLPNYIHASYAYYPGVALTFGGIPNISIPYPEDFSGTRLQANAIVMADSTATWNGWTLGINHTTSHSTNREITRDLAGMNRLFGDGRVQWQSRQFLRPDLMATSATSDEAGAPLRHIRNQAPDVIYY